MMKQIAIATLLTLSLACAKNEGESTAPPAERVADPSTAATATVATATTSGVKTYPMNAVIVSRDAAKNMVNLDNEDVPGVMAPMKMDYELRGAKVDSLPADGTKVQVTLHDENGTYWVTDVKPVQ